MSAEPRHRAGPHSGQPLSLEKALGMVLRDMPRVGTEDVELEAAQGRVLAGDVRSTQPAPAFDNSAMDGYAVVSSDLHAASVDAPVSLDIVGESKAGSPWRGTLSPGQACRIMTGAAVPAGADAVVPLEETRERARAVDVFRRVAAWENVRRAGEDLPEGQVVLRKGARVGAVHLGLLAYVGASTVAVARQPRACLLVTGEELVEVGSRRKLGQVWDVNTWTLAALAREAGACLVARARVGDDADAIAEILRGLCKADWEMLVVSGGASVGRYDRVRAALSDLGWRELFWRVAIRPGMPTAFGRLSDRAVFCLPGNPVSCIISFLKLVRPAILASQGARDQHLPTARARAAFNLDLKPGRTTYLRCVRRPARDGSWILELAGSQSSSSVGAFAAADCLAVVPPEKDGVREGEELQVELLDFLAASG